MIDSVCEAEYITASDAAKKVVWLWKFIIELKVVPSIDGPVLLYCDSSRAIAQVKESKSHHHTKYILCRYHLVQEIVNRGNIELQKIDEKKNLIDLFTKALGVKEFEDYKSKMDIQYYTDWLYSKWELLEIVS